MAERGHGSDRAYAGRGNNRRLIYADDVMVSQGAAFYCPACRSDMHYNRGNASRAACFKHNRSVSQEIKDSCPIYSGVISSEAYGEGYGSQITVALQVTRCNDPRWSFKLRLPRTDELHETIVVRADNVRKNFTLTGSRSYEDVQIAPRRVKYFVDGEVYRSRLRNPYFDARTQRAFVFPVRASETSVRSRRLFWGLSYYVLLDAGKQIALEGARITPWARTQEYLNWKCVQVALPDTIDDNVAQWFRDEADAYIEPAPYKVRPLLGSIGERRVFTCFGETQYVVALREEQVRDNQRWLMVSKNSLERPTAHFLETKVAVAAINSSGFCALGLAASDDDDTWPLSLIVDWKTWSEPLLPIAVFVQDGVQIKCTLGDAQSAELLVEVSRRLVSFECVLPSVCTAVVRHKPIDALNWSRDTFVLETESECRRLVEALGALLHGSGNEIVVDVDGVGSLRVSGDIVSETQPNLMVPRAPRTTWASYVSLRKRTCGYSDATAFAEGLWPHW